MRIFLMHYDKLKYKLYQEDVYEAMQETGLFADYRIEQCRQDLDMLTEWKNLEAYQDTRRVAAIEEFKNKKFEYSMTDVGVEVERLVQRLENLHIEGASLEPSLLERIRKYISEFAGMAEDSQENSRVYAWWSDLSSDFVRLNQNYKDYMSNLSSVKAEQMMQTRAFHAFKDQLVEYLRNFIKNLQRNVGAIEEELRQVTEEQKAVVFGKVIAYELSIPRIGEEITRQEIEQKIYDRWQSIFEWFCGTGNDDNEAGSWVSNMNQLMSSMNTSSGLKLSLKWRSKTAEAEDQLDTGELVQLLKKDYLSMTETESQRLSAHFRSKVEEARRSSGEQAGLVSFYQVMKDTLDYRKWFEFQLFAQKTGERQKELTNSVFGTFSGGEKAMAMYVPLFSAVVAKYEGGSKNAPRLISLDEAFAGVDSRNIRDMPERPCAQK